uniref:Reverse transcriptase domain-containing protein n=1 Tax=Oreochromis niloticus TaxID=8128 RepID=A0A669AWP7_ORENI
MAKVIIVGDFNIHVDDSTNSTTKEFLSIMDSFNFVQHVAGPTHRAGHTLDLVFTCGVSLDHMNLNEVVFSDHKSVSFTVSVNSESHPQGSIRRRRFIDDSTISEFSSLFNFKSSSNEVELLTNSFNEHCLAILNQVAPFKSSYCSLNSRTPWLNNQTRGLRRSYRKAERLWKSTGLTVHREHFKELLYLYNESVKEARSSYFNNLINRHKNNSRILFDTINSIVSPPTQHALLLSDEDCNTFLNYFVNKVMDLKSKISSSASPYEDTPCCLGSFTSFSPITLNDLIIVLGKMKSSSCSVDILPHSVLSGSITSIGPTLLSIINSSLRQGCVPSYFKHAVVSPLLKKQNLDPSSASNYRPISKLPFLSKLLEKIVENQFRSLLCKLHILDPFQSGFQKQHSTETALLRVYNDLLMASDAGNCSVIILLDLSAAFDTIDHKILLNRLKVLAGVSASALDWFSSYLSDRTFSVRTDRFTSDTAALTCGVPQGSVLGPLLFSFYMLPLAGIIQSFSDLSYHFYADDIQLHMSFKPHQLDRLSTLVQCLTQVSDWLSSNYLVLNTNKTETMIIAPPELHSRISQVLASFCPSVKSNIRNLGVIFDSSLDLDSHVKSLSRSCFYHLRNISKLRHMVSSAELQKLIHAFVSSRLDYCNSLFTSLDKSSLSRLQAIQNAAARLLTCSTKRVHITPILYSLHWLPIEFRIRFKILVLTYRALNGPRLSIQASYKIHCCSSSPLTDSKSLSCSPYTTEDKRGQSLSVCCTKAVEQFTTTVTFA